jgi:hypothetical protein
MSDQMSSAAAPARNTKVMNRFDLTNAWLRN